LVVAVYGISLVARQLLGPALNQDMYVPDLACYMGETVSPYAEAGAVLCLVAVPLLLWQGLRSRTAPTWIAVAALLGSVVLAHERVWWVGLCLTERGMVLFWLRGAGHRTNGAPPHRSRADHPPVSPSKIVREGVAVELCGIAPGDVPRFVRHAGPRRPRREKQIAGRDADDKALGRWRECRGRPC